jgi:protein-S-isoprenylcysteine O-methyltransferase Ste14
MSIFWLSLTFLLWGVVHSLLASLPAKALARQLFGSGTERFYRLGYNLFAGVSLLPTAWLLLVLPDRNLYTIPPPWAVLLLIGQLLALLALVIGMLQTGLLAFLGLSQLWSTQSGGTELVSRGLYRFVRHPLYTAGLAFIWLSPRMTVNRLTLTVAATLYILLGATFEERKLRREYGEAYVRYAAVTPMLIPFTKWNKALP